LPSNIKTQGSYTYLKSSTMLNMWGEPCAKTEDCSSVTSSSLKTQIATRTIGKFKVTGMSRALDALERAITNVQTEKPDLYNALGNSGMLCCRLIRGSSSSYSNHAWGAAIDFNIGGDLDPRGDNKAQQGLHDMYPYMHAQGFYWAAGYSGSSEDAMHFEIANEVMLTWGTSGGSSSSSNYVCVTASGLNIRSAACDTSTVLTTAPYGTKLERLDSTTYRTCGSLNWYKVRYGSTVGYASSTYLTTSCSSFQDSGDSGNYTDSFDNFDYEAQGSASSMDAVAALSIAAVGAAVAIMGF